ncbi:MAG: hypothetical protein IT182_08270 [Acidobacteria bacterium]|nr:hypothetical protein [Acidobacteriota bacterium]
MNLLTVVILRTGTGASEERYAGVVRGKPFFAKSRASSRADWVWLAFLDTS